MVSPREIQARSAKERLAIFAYGSSDAAIATFRDVLLRNDVMATTRRTRGDDIDAACGQLVGRVQDRTIVRLGSKRIPLQVNP